MTSERYKTPKKFITEDLDPLIEKNERGLELTLKAKKTLEDYIAELDKEIQANNYLEQDTSSQKERRAEARKKLTKVEFDESRLRSRIELMYFRRGQLERLEIAPSDIYSSEFRSCGG